MEVIREGAEVITNRVGARTDRQMNGAQQRSMHLSTKKTGRSPEGDRPEVREEETSKIVRITPRTKGDRPPPVTRWAIRNKKPPRRGNLGEASAGVDEDDRRRSTIDEGDAAASDTGRARPAALPRSGDSMGRVTVIAKPAQQQPAPWPRPPQAGSSPASVAPRQATGAWRIPRTAARRRGLGWCRGGRSSLPRNRQHERHGQASAHRDQPRNQQDHGAEAGAVFVAVGHTTTRCDGVPTAGRLPTTEKTMSEDPLGAIRSAVVACLIGAAGWAIALGLWWWLG